MKQQWKVAAVQMTSTDDVARNVDAAEDLIRSAVEDGADLVALPENFAFLKWEGSSTQLKVTLDGELVTRMRLLAADAGAHLLLGSIPVEDTGGPRFHNTSVLIDPAGELVATYRKIHLFDIDIPGGVTFQESSTVAPGTEPVVVATDLGRLGLSICYDLRFPELYRRLARDGAQVLFVPAAFTAYTGPAHWLPLLRARAIENLCWVVAPAQVGVHNDKRASHGETVVIDPWGTVTACRMEGEGVVLADIDLDRVDEVRRGLPCHEHVRPEIFS